VKEETPDNFSRLVLEEEDEEGEDMVKKKLCIPCEERGR